ncbi:nucleoside diphosphatase Gda1 [Cordyceps fumosorosea ARSEF 2679]|uniref:Nucleoside diphosphatase Gda1 n=1 Tax=Cordyceps fumosorosea (strain ARSEF 2679) TaxID=1081104 RepID=A0A167WQ84_CORFA|nr:nucleoside diphosphatase Gda1 [Cordyceps fumosorosea ARSEF 2679]OAA64075.1 nucleoside diphosphatase Gda1 [Cordyceps fumosorosea ARSEF 2679]
MNPPYQPPGPQQAFPQSMPPPDGPPNYQRSTPSQLQLPAPRQLLQYADSYRQASSQSQLHYQHPSMNLPPPHQPMAAPHSQPQHQQQHQPHLHQQHQPSALTPSHPSRRESYANDAGYASANTSSKDAEPPQAVLTSVSHVDEVDRRPITPPPCVRLTILDIATGKEINYNEIDHAMFVLNVDLWNADGTREVNLVRSSAAASSSASSSANPHGFSSYSAIEPTQDAHAVLPGPDASYRQQRAASYSSEYPSQATYNDENNTYRPGGTYSASSQHYSQHQAYRPEQSMVPDSNGGHSRLVSTPEGGQDPGNMTRMSVGGGQPQGMFTRNLIGSVAVSAFNLCDTEGKRGIWFVLQDLSVRTEGNFRLRFSFVNVGPRGGRAPQDGTPAKVTTGRAPILASSCSEVFSVFSAKKFPGVCESTALSKTFAVQGIKIPIRKEAGGKCDDEDGYGD